MRGRHESEVRMRRTRLLCVLGVSLSSAVIAASQAASPAALSPELRAHMRDEQLGVVTSMRGLPLGVRDALQALFGGALDIAEPGAAFQRTAATAGSTLPGRRLIAAGCSTDHCLVYYERGGAAQTWHVALFHWRPAATRLEWGGIAPGGLTTIEEVRKALLSGALTADQGRF